MNSCSSWFQRFGSVFTKCRSGGSATVSPDSVSGVDFGEEYTNPEIVRFAKAMDRKLRRLDQDAQRRHEETLREFDRVAKKLRTSMVSEAIGLKSSAGKCATAVLNLHEELVSVKSQLQAVRDYAAEQQEQLRKYEDGFSWRVVKTLGIRIIHRIYDVDFTLLNSGKIIYPFVESLLRQVCENGDHLF